VKATGYFLLYRPWQLRWGATGEEVRATLPGDELLPDRRWCATRAVTVEAGPEHVWPWLVQMGAGRAGWYSYDRIDNGGVPSARAIRPDLQRLHVGDRMRFTAGSDDALTVQRIEDERSLVLVSQDPDGIVVVCFTLRPVGARMTRLVHRVQFSARPRLRSLPWVVGMDAGDFVMSRRMLLGIRERAERLERAGATGPGASGPGVGTTGS
jgi:hypothetical protein